MTPAGHAIFAFVATDGRVRDRRAPFIAALGAFSGKLAAESESPRLEKRADPLPRVFRTRRWHHRVVLRKFGIRAVRVRSMRLRGLGSVDGFAISWVANNSPAARRGLEAGDVVIALRGMPVRSGDHLRIVLGGSGVSVGASITIVRRGKIRSLALAAPTKRVSKPS